MSGIGHTKPLKSAQGGCAAKLLWARALNRGWPTRRCECGRQSPRHHTAAACRTHSRA